MNEKHEELLSDARNYVTDTFTQHVKPHFVFHTLEHTEDVVEACSIMVEHYNLSDEDRLVLLLAAWFHDTGYTKGEAAGHEEESSRIAAEFLEKRNIDYSTVQRVSSCIKATRMPQSPVSLVEQILCDADLYHLATDDFKARNALLKQEQEALLGHKIPKKEWRRNNILFLETHKYFTEYGREHLEPKKLENLNDIRGKKERKEEARKAEEEEAFPYVYEPNMYSGDKEDIKIQQKNTERGVQTMFRTTSNNHFELSSLADSKSNIMISVNAIIISVVLTVLIARLPFYPQYIIPTLLLLVVCLAAVIFAILATRPSVNQGRFTEEDIRGKKTNLLFFGNFHRMKLEEYQWAMNEMLKDREYLYNSMIKDIYFLGVVLAKKYRYLRISYTIFMWGLIIAVIAFAIAGIYGTSMAAASSSRTPVIDY
jgi:predicted metal-dependent HD superfamily phosphohydrolase